MDKTKYYLRPDVIAEPLVDHWYAWSHLISPASAAMNVTYHHLPVMESYVRAPGVHAAAVADPATRGGPFIDLDGKRVDEIRSLLNLTKRERLPQIELAHAIQETDAILRADGKGFSLEPLYERLPACLKGYVELVYDRENNPSMRFIEPLLYKSAHFFRSAQTFMCSRKEGDRPFILSTPRLIDESSLHLRLQFDDPAVDQLFATRLHARDFSTIADIFSVSNGQQENLLRTFLTEVAPPAYRPYEGRGVRWRYFGHGCVLVETAGTKIVIDPVLNYGREGSDGQYTLLDLPDQIDYVLISHNHQDHVLLETLLQLRHKIGTVVVPTSSTGALQDPSLKLLFRESGFQRVRDLDVLETLAFPSGEITALPFFGEHSDLDIQTKRTFLIRIGDCRLLFAADTRNIEPAVYEHVHRIIGDVDVLFVGMECDGAPLSWVYGPLLTRPLTRAMDQSRRLSGSDCNQALALVNTLNCRQVYVYAMGQEPWLNYISRIRYTEASNPIVESNRLIEICRSRGLIAERLYGTKNVTLSPMMQS